MRSTSFLLIVLLLGSSIQPAEGQEGALQVEDLWQQRAWLLHGKWKGTVSQGELRGVPVHISVDVTMNCFRGTIEFPNETDPKRKSRSFHVCPNDFELAIVSFNPARGKYNLMAGGFLRGGKLTQLGIDSKEAAVTATLKGNALLIRIEGKDESSGPVLRLMRSSREDPLERKTEWIWKPAGMIALANQYGYYPVEIEGVLGLPEHKRLKMQSDPKEKVLLEPYGKEDLNTGNYGGLIYRVRFAPKPQNPNFEFKQFHGQTEAEYEQATASLPDAGFREIYQQSFYDSKYQKRVNGIWSKE